MIQFAHTRHNIRKEKQDIIKSPHSSKYCKALENNTMIINKQICDTDDDNGAPKRTNTTSEQAVNVLPRERATSWKPSQCSIPVNEV